MIGEASFKRFMSLRQELFNALSMWGEMTDRDGIVKITSTFESGGNCKGNSIDPYQKIKYAIEIEGESHDLVSFENDNFDKILDEFEEYINQLRKLRPFE